MRHSVTWDRDAERELTQIWLDAIDQRDVADAANTIDRELFYDAELKGEEFYGDRLLVVPPLSVTYQVFPKDNLVVVRQVFYRPQSP